jgi:hypothetical protein
VKQITLSHPNFPDNDQTLVWKRSFKGGMLVLDILFTPGYGLSGIIVDASTSAWYGLPPNVTYDFSTKVASPDHVKSVQEASAMKDPKKTSEATPSL